MSLSVKYSAASTFKFERTELQVARLVARIAVVTLGIGDSSPFVPSLEVLA